MFKTSFRNSVYYLFVKYVVFFFILAFMGSRFKNAVINNAETPMEFIRLTVVYMIYILLHVFFLVLFFSVPLYYILKIDSKIYFVLSIIAFLGFEYLAYTHLFSPSNNVLGIYNLIIGIAVFILFFRKPIIQIMKPR